MNFHILRVQIICKTVTYNRDTICLSNEVDRLRHHFVLVAMFMCGHVAYWAMKHHSTFM